MTDSRSAVPARFNGVGAGRYRVLVQVVILLLMCVGLIAGSLNTGSARAASKTSQTPLLATSFTLDGVTLSLSSSYIPGKFVVASGDNMGQMAYSVAWRPYKEIEIESIPFNVVPALEALPPAHSGGVAQYRSLLHLIRAQQGGQVIANSPAITIFGQQVQGETHLLTLSLDGPAQPAIVTEYVTEAGNRMWLIRMTQEASTHDALHASATTAFLRSLSTINLSSTTLNNPSPLVASLASEARHQGIHRSSASSKALPSYSHTLVSNTAPFPSWWNGNCDYYNYANSGWPGSSWQMANGRLDGVVACGPRPGAGGYDYSVKFSPNASWGAYEWECVELSLRWMYLEWGVPAYPGNGNGMVKNFKQYNPNNTAIKEVYNTPGCCLFPQAGDVLSYCSACTAGHTSVVMSSSVNGNGNGSATVMEENGTHDGTEILTISNYQIISSSPGPIYGYLHNFG